MKIALKILFSIFLVVLILLFSLTCYLFIALKNYNLDPNKLKTNVINYEFYDSNNNLVFSEDLGGKNSYIKLDELKTDTLNAFIAIEDREFYRHKGYNLKRIIGATIKNVKSLSLKEGASTISQQLIKNTHLNSEKTIKRKLAELKITMQLEKTFSKEEILEKYLNTIYFGKGNYGIESASRYYFNKSAKNLTLNESAVLAGIIKSPKNYSPILSYDNAVKRKNLVLKCMLDCKFITKSEYDNNVKLKITLNSDKSKNYLSDYIKAVKNEIEDLSIINPYQNSKIKVYTYLDVNLQKQIANQSLKECENYDASKIVINNKNKGIIAFYGNNSNLKRCPASCVKPWLVYAPMIDDKYITESSVIDDNYVNYNGYTPKNFNNKYMGNVTVKDALKLSLNVPAVKLVDGYGINKINNYTNKMGVIIENEGLPCALGALNNGLTLKELCDKYTTFSNDGFYENSSFIDKVIVENKEIYKTNSNKIKVFSPETSYIINDILKESVKSGTSKNLSGFNFDICGKTGTNGDKNGNLDAYSIAYTTNHTIGVWLGCQDNSYMPNNVTGGTYPTVYVREIVKYLYKNTKPDNFVCPKNVVKLNLDKESLIKNQVESIPNNDLGEDFYYILGTEPKNLNNNEIEYNGSEIYLYNDLITIKNSSINADNLKIIKTYQGKNEIIYNGKYIEIFEYKLNQNGIYNFTLVFENANGKTKEIKLKSIKYDKNLPIINEDWWEL